MATVKVKRKKSTGNSGVTLKAGEPYYNLVDKKLFVGSVDDELVDDSKKHIAEITQLSSNSSNRISFSIGEGSGNTFTQEVNNVSYATNCTNATNAVSASRLNYGQAVLDSKYYGTQTPDEVDSIRDADNGTIYIQIQA